MKKDSWPRFFAFFLIPALVVSAANFWLSAPNGLPYFTAHEMLGRNDIDIAFVGSSTVYYGINPAIIEEKTGLTPYDIAFDNMGLHGARAAIDLLLENNSPQWVVLVLDNDNIDAQTEAIETQSSLMPQLPRLSQRLSYYFDLVSTDHRFISRLFYFKNSCISTVDKAKKKWLLHKNPRAYYEQSALKTGPDFYKGRGYVRSIDPGDIDQALRAQPLKTYVANPEKGLHSFPKRQLRRIDALCRRHGAKLMVLIEPTIVAKDIGAIGLVDTKSSLRKFCAKENIPCFDFSLAKPELMPSVEDYHFDWNHLNGEGSDIFSAAIADLFNLYTSGEPVNHLFYASADEKLAKVDYVTNVWLEEEQGETEDVLCADSNYGPCVTPEYRFELREADGSWTVLRDYSTDCTYAFPSGSLSGRCVRVYARPQGSRKPSHIYNDLISHGC